MAYQSFDLFRLNFFRSNFSLWNWRVTEYGNILSRRNFLSYSKVLQQDGIIL